MDLHCSPPSNVLEHDLGVSSHVHANLFLAVVEAMVMLMADMPNVEASLRKDADAAKCPDNCPTKMIGKSVNWRGVRFNIGFDAKRGGWYCAIGIAAEIDILCEDAREEGASA